MVDADGATRFSDLDKLEVQLKQVERDGLGIAVGSRAHLVRTDAVVKVWTMHHIEDCLFFSNVTREVPYLLENLIPSNPCGLLALLYPQLSDALVPQDRLYSRYPRH